ncbi:universal stress protein [Haloparvum alkalitolerans]|uniref:universal stress protein n=1 Tax=Haloparvum alkalitolerans TaxID=1042953 RepID=UPI003CEEEE3D
MDHALAVVGPTEESKELVREAGELAAGVDAKLTLLYGTTEEEYNDQRVELEEISNYEASYSVTQAMQGAKNYAADVGREVLDDLDVEWEAHGAIGDMGETVLTEADRYDCDHVFVTGQKRSPTGKAIFGDETQRIVLDFDGPVTVLTV